jgi:PBP1b-binding outer membrane lipoprotein LpoB
MKRVWGTVFLPLMALLLTSCYGQAAVGSNNEQVMNVTTVKLDFDSVALIIGMLIVLAVIGMVTAGMAAGGE